MTIKKNVDVIISAVDQYSDELSSFGLGMGKIAAGAAVVEAAILGASVAAAKLTVDIGQSLFRAATDFSGATLDVTAVAQSFGTTQEDVSEILDKLTVKFPLTGKQAGDAMQRIAQEGYGAKDAMENMASSAVTLQIATGVDLDTGIRAVVNTMDAFQMSIEDTDRVVNALAQTAFTSAANVAELREGLKYAAPIASAAGWSFEETVAAVAKLIGVGLEASQAGTTLRMAISQLMKETDRGAAALAKYGLTYADVNPEVNSLAEIIGKFEGKTLGAKDAVDIFGVRAMTMNMIIRNGVDDFEGYTDSITGTTAAYDAMAVKMQKWSVVQDMVAGDIDVFKNTIAKELVPAVVDLVGKTENEGIRGVITQLKELEAEHHAIGRPLVETFTSLKDILSEVFKSSFGDVEGLYNWLSNIASALGANLEILAIWGSEFLKAMGADTDSASKLVTILRVVNTAIAAIAIPIAAIHDMFAGLFDLVMIGTDAIQWAWASAMGNMTEGLLELYRMADRLPFVDMAQDIAEAEASLESWRKKAEQAFNHEPVQRWSDNVVTAMVKADDAIDDMADDAAGAQWKMANGWKPVEDGTAGLVKEAKEYDDALISGTLALEAMAGSYEEVEEAVVDVTEKTEEMEDALKRAHELAKLEVEWKAKIDIEKIQAATEVLKAQSEEAKAAFDSIGGSVEAAATASADMFSSLVGGIGDLLGTGTYSDMQKMAAEQLDIQRDLADAQIELTEAEAELMESRRRKIDQGGDLATINVQIEGDTEGWLAGLVQSLFENIMAKAEAEAFACLCTE